MSGGSGWIGIKKRKKRRGNNKMRWIMIMRRQERSRSPVSVHEWVAALPDIDKDAESEERTEERDSDIAEDDNLTLGAEGESVLTF